MQTGYSSHRRLGTYRVQAAKRTGYNFISATFFLLVNCNHATIPLFRYTEFAQFFAIVAKNGLVSVLISKGIDPGDNNK